MLYERPDLLHEILRKNTEAVIAYLNAQIAAGAQAVMVFDSWGGALSAAAYQEFSLAYATQVMAGITRSSEGRIVPRIFFTKGGGLWLESIAGCGADALGLDWTVDIGEAKRRVGSRVALQGNMDSSAKLARCSRVSPPTEAGPDTYSIWDTGYRNSPRPNGWKRSLTLSTAPHKARRAGSHCQARKFKNRACLFTEIMPSFAPCQCLDDT
jgi:Uroporphyrinogen decarboxylase (URO-D)